MSVIGGIEKVKKIWYSSKNEYVKLKIVINMPIGLLLGIAYYYVGVHRLELGRELDLVIGVGVVSGLAVGWAVSQQIRAASVLIIPTMFTREGRFWLTTYTYSLLLTGPIENIIVNSEETIRGVTCSLRFIEAQNAEKKNLLQGPIQNYSSSIGLELSLFDTKLKDLSNGFSTSSFAVDKNGDVVTNEESDYADDSLAEQQKADEEADRVIEARNQLENKKQTAERSCNEMFQNAQENCYKKYEEIQQNCGSSATNKEPRLTRRFCGKIFTGDSGCSGKVDLSDARERCDSGGTLGPGFEDAYGAQSRSQPVSNTQEEVNFKMKKTLYERKIDQTSREDVIKSVEQELIRKRQLVELITLSIQRLLAFSFILVLRKAWKYTVNYKTDILFDNVYITEYFKHIDNRRREKKKLTILPLRSYEKAEIINLSSAKLVTLEKKSLSKNVSMWVLRLAVTGVLLTIDSVLYQILDVLRRHGLIEVTQEGYSSLDVRVLGNGTVADTMRTLVKDFNYSYVLNETLSNDVCLPHPSKVPTHLIGNIFFIASVQLVFALVEAYGLRMRRWIAATFYRKREKKRILYLYNDMVKKRRGYLRHARHKVRKRVLMHTFEKPPSFKLPCMKVGWGMECVVCETKLNQNEHQCANRRCGIWYCYECWINVKGYCLACTDPEQLKRVLSEMTMSDQEEDDTQ